MDGNESQSGLAKLLAATWDLVAVRRLRAGDVAIGHRILVERKTADDFLASLDDGRLFRQARWLASSVPRPILIQEGDPDALEKRMKSGAYRGALLALSVGFRIPVLTTRDVGDTARVLRHMAAQESKRASRRRQRAGRAAERSDGATSNMPHSLPPEAVDILLALPRVGPTRAAALATRLQSVGDLARLGIRDLLSIPGIGPDTAARIFDTMRGHK